MLRATIAVGLLGVCYLTQVETQPQPTPQAGPGRLNPLDPSPAPSSKSNPLSRFFGSTKAQRDLDAKIDQAARAMRQAESDDARARAEHDLKQLLGQDYDDRLKGYEEELERLEKTLVEMRRKLARRRDAKPEMIKLRVRVLQAEAEDLGWPVRHRRSSFPSLTRGSSGIQWRDAVKQPGGK